ncbi:MAG: hypothetical protein WAN65_09610 [Candidatus Sulfotelmatobacter sp.]
MNTSQHTERVCATVMDAVYDHADRCGEQIIYGYVRVFRSKGFSERQKKCSRDEIRTSYDRQFSRKISPELADLLLSLDGERPLADLLGCGQAVHRAPPGLLPDLQQLWAERLIILRAPAQEVNA